MGGAACLSARGEGAAGEAQEAVHGAVHVAVDFAQMGRGAWLVQSADVDAVACFISREMREMQDAFTPAIA